MRPILKKDGLAYIDSCLGMIPCKVLSVTPSRIELSYGVLTGFDAVVKVTANRPAYKRGEVIKRAHTNIVPRNAVFVRCGQYRIRKYDTVPD